MMKSRNLLCLLFLSAAAFGPGVAVAADEPATSTSVPGTTDTGTDTSSDTAPLTLDQDQIDALTEQANGTEADQSAFEKASDFVTDNAPWFIIGIIVLAAIIAGILIMRGRPRKKSGAAGIPKASKSTKAMRDAGGLAANDAPAQVPSASELRRRKRAAIQRSREEERIRRKSGLEERKAVRRGAPAAPIAATAAGATAVTAAGAAAGALDPVEAEKQGARDQETAAAAVARFGGVAEPAPAAEVQAGPVPAPVAPSQTAPAAGIVTPDSTAPAQPAAESEPAYEPAPATDTTFEPAPEPAPMPEAETGIIHEPSIENPGPDAVVGNAAESFLAGGAAGAVGGLAAARATQPGSPPAEPVEPLDPVIAPEPGMAPEHALADPIPPQPVAPPAEEADATAAAEERLRAKVAEIKATQEPVATEPEPVAEPAAEPDLPVPGVELSPGLAAVERKLSENSEERDRALRDAEERLRRVEQRAEDAERRAAFAERLAQLKVEESDRERRLNDVVTGIDRAESRAIEAEARAESAERAAAAALGQSDLNVPEPSPASVPPVEDKPDPPVSAAPPREDPPADEPTLPERRGLFGGSTPTPSASSDAVNLNSATFEELREAGLSVTQATRILAYRERFGGYTSVDDLEKVPGFPSDLIESLRGRIDI